ncbi:hypothetical protein ACFQ49_05215 [Kroppenstedtia eburnea]|uniref:hypothetical protein n=1 Tax=Kroppenstedtia eburnea TaxID=714067 RepID=UPI001F40979A|nr:hypothetical protein [Kroppenstedtia eburnea]
MITRIAVPNQEKNLNLRSSQKDKAIRDVMTAPTPKGLVTKASLVIQPTSSAPFTDFGILFSHHTKRIEAMVVIFPHMDRHPLLSSGYFEPMPLPVILETDFYLNAEQGQTHSGKDVKRQWKFGFRFGAD